eukprot:202782-Pleurochrysis_carterae.AAC.1
MRAAAALSRFAASPCGAPRTSSACDTPPCRVRAPAPSIARGPSASARALLVGRHKRLSNSHARHTKLKG